MVPIRGLRVRSERGAELVEFALVLPLLLVLIGGIVDFGFLFQRYEVVTNAAREGARLRSLAGYTDACRADARQGVHPGGSQSDAGAARCGRAQHRRQVSTSRPERSPESHPPCRRPSSPVTYQHNFIMLGPIMSLINATWSNQINVYATSQMRLEATGRKLEDR